MKLLIYTLLAWSTTLVARWLSVSSTYNFSDKFFLIKTILVLPIVAYILFKEVNKFDISKSKIDSSIILLLGLFICLFLFVPLSKLPLTVPNIKTLLLTTVGTIVLVSFEELVYRRLAFDILSTKLNSKGYILLSSMIFGLAHIANVLYTGQEFTTSVQIGFAFIFGIIFSRVYLTYKTILYPIALHFTVNIYQEYKEYDIQFTDIVKSYNAIHWDYSFEIIAMFFAGLTFWIYQNHKSFAA